MSEASSIPEPSHSPGTDPTGPPTPAPDQAPSSAPGLPTSAGAAASPSPDAAPWASLDPLAPPQAWAAPEPWAPPTGGREQFGSAASDAGPPPATTPGAPAADGSLPGGQPWSGHVPSGWPPGQPGWPAEGHPAQVGWPPAGYPPPFAYPGRPPTRPGGGDAKVIALVVGLVVVLVLGLCCCIGLFGFVAGEPDDRTTASDPWYDTDGTEPADPPTFPADPPTFPADPSKKPVTRPTAGPAPVTVVYEVTGSGRADVAYFDADSDLIHVDGAKLPWRTTIRTNGQSRVMVEATRPYDESEPLTCRLSVTGAGRPVTDTTTAVWRTTCSTG
ncbi:MmpS family transport accessory protein [Micromonospora sp. NPDC002296]|uniref:MmpS family transport accessory protein n=1 Tax=Micromonospora sp. NPDC002296 TaxID=3154271 RepID=UPI0033290E5C